MKPASWQWVALIGVAILGVGLGLTALILALDDDTASPSLLAALPAPDRAAPAPSHTEAVPIPGAGARGVQEAAQPTRGAMRGLLLGLAVRDTDAGLTVHAVLPGGGAAAAGVEPGDVLRRLDGRDIDTRTALVDALATHQPGDVVTLNLERSGEPLSPEVTLAPPSREGLPPDGSGFFDGFPRRHPVLGLRVDITDDGLVVQHVRPGSGAAEVGLQPNDVIRSLNGVPVESPEAVRDALADLLPGDTVSLRIERDGAELTLDVALGPGGFPFGHGEPSFPPCHEGGFAPFPFPFPRFPGLPNGSFEFDGRFEGAGGALHVEAAGGTLLSLSDDAVTVATNDAERTFTLDGETTVRGEPTPGDRVLVVALNGEARLIAATPHLLPSPPPASAAQA